MDPNANLREMLELARHMASCGRTEDICGSNEHEPSRLAELVEALDGWITKGGFLPDRWRVTQNFHETRQENR